MNCSFHPESPSVAFCRECGKALCAACQRPAEDRLLQEHQPVPQALPRLCLDRPRAWPKRRPLARFGADSSVSPGLAFLLGLIPGVAPSTTPNMPRAWCTCDLGFPGQHCKQRRGRAWSRCSA